MICLFKKALDFILYLRFQTLGCHFCHAVYDPFCVRLWKYLWGISVGHSGGSIQTQHCTDQLHSICNQIKMYYNTMTQQVYVYKLESVICDLWWNMIIYTYICLMHRFPHVFPFLSSHVRELHCVHWAANQAGPAEVHAVQNPGKEFS